MTTQAVERYFLNELNPEEREAFEEHYFSCTDCADAVRLGTVLIVNGREVSKELQRHPLKTGQVTEISSGPGRGARPRWITSIPAAAAAMLAVVVGYQNLVSIPNMKSAWSRPRALTPIVLRGQSRGDSRVDKVNGDSAASVTMELHADHLLRAYRVSVLSHGKSIAEIPEARVSNGSLAIYFPPELPQGSYEAIVRAPDGSDAGHYTFEK